MKFQFDPAKAKSNLKKHNVSFADAEGVFYDPLAIHTEDSYTSQEERFVAVGMGSAGQILVVFTRSVTMISGSFRFAMQRIVR